MTEWDIRSPIIVFFCVLWSQGGYLLFGRKVVAKWSQLQVNASHSGAWGLNFAHISDVLSIGFGSFLHIMDVDMID